MTEISKNGHIDKLDGIVKEYNNKYHASIKMKPDDVKDNRNIDFKKEIIDTDPKFKVGDHVRISKYKNLFAKGYIVCSCHVTYAFQSESTLYSCLKVKELLA